MSTLSSFIQVLDRMLYPNLQIGVLYKGRRGRVGCTSDS